MLKKYFNSAHQALSSETVLPVDNLIGSGNDRDCWRLLDYPSLCIKIAKPEQERPQNEIDFHYAQHLAKKSISSKHMPKVYGWVLSNRGVGLVSDLVLDFDGRVSKPILQALDTNTINLEQAKAIVNEGFAWLIKDKVILGDYGINNLLVQNYEPNKFRLVIVDGLGARNFGWRYLLNRVLGFKAIIKAKEFRQMTCDILDKAVL